jgi:hypothetical protein
LVDSEGIVGEHEWDRFKVNEEVAERDGYWTNPVDPHLVVWYQMETLTSFAKLYGRIQGTLKQGNTYELRLTSNFDS